MLCDPPLRWVREVEPRKRDLVIDVPPLPGVIAPGHTWKPLPFEMLSQFRRGAAHPIDLPVGRAVPKRIGQPISDLLPDGVLGVLPVSSHVRTFTDSLRL